MDNLYSFLLPARTAHEVRLASITAHRQPVIGTWSAETEGYPLAMHLIAPYDTAMGRWMENNLWLRFRPLRPPSWGEPVNIVARPTSVAWQAGQQEYQVVVTPIVPVFDASRPVEVAIGVDGKSWHILPLYDRFALLVLVPAGAKVYTELIMAQIKKMHVRYFPVLYSTMRGIKLTLEVETTWPYVAWLLDRVAIRLTLKNGLCFEADICASEPFLVGTTKFTAVFDRNIGRADIDHVDLVLPTSPTTNFIHRLI